VDLPQLPEISVRDPARSGAAVALVVTLLFGAGAGEDLTDVAFGGARSSARFADTFLFLDVVPHDSFPPFSFLIFYR